MDRRDFSKKLLATASMLPMMSSFTAGGSDNQFPRKIIKPKQLKRGDTIGLVTPASPITEEKLQLSVTNLEKLGLRVVYNEKRVLAKNGYLAGSDLLRADEINLMFQNPDIDGIWCVRGGYGGARILGMLNYKIIKENPKVFVGYSDITALHQAIFKYTGLVCFHGPAAASEFSDYSVAHLENILMNPQPEYLIEASSENLSMEDSNYKPLALSKGIAEGRLIGGNLTLASSLIGTYFDVNYDNRIVFLEDVGEKPYRIDRMITQLLMAGKFQRVRGVALGIFANCQARTDEDSLTLMEVLIDRFQYFKIPIIYGMSFGHIANQFTLPLGIEVQLDAENNTMKLLEAAVTKR
jgi:muramoyltetrapeptide carboxypeptidase